ncbi:glycoside hydrolase family 2 protein [Gracilibacillus sp. S3-1-1]|uniref:Glycoside hydrolase family 2 protein n=1 Tax=Gracilibacillus pellucidus TaxID=3095368 RepID=A0ACC6M8E2_9BACI|nr:glycoside hydrolase family 2 protein [Gracilibacillus sp. S3-1-1]MDX8047141.1 glycoside hydrolase family 2 protein [Gracilibacillus sp. S3-1-1]
MKKINFNNEWFVRGVNNSTKYSVTLPESVMNILLENNEISDPYYRDNEDQALEIAKNDYKFWKKFNVDQSLIEHENISICFHGIDTVAEVSINDQFVAKTENMHRVYEWDIKPYLELGENELQVTLYSPLNYIKEKQADDPLIGVHHAVEGFQHLRKSHSMFGWDWGPKIPDLGIWRDVELLAWNENRISRVHVKQDHSDTQDQVNVSVEVDLEKEPDGIETAVLLTSPKGKKREIICMQTDKRKSFSLIVDNPTLWWPAGYGEQSLYSIEVILKKDGKVIDKQTKQIGLRTIYVRHEKDQWGKSFEFVINGYPLFMKGANYIPEDNLLPRLSKQRTERLIEDSVAANFNMIRVWGGGHYPEDYFYELCDQHGIIVWQDFMFACSVYPMNDDFKKNVIQEASTQIKRLRHHACLGIWCGNNEVEEAMEYWGWPKREDWRESYIELFERDLRDQVAIHDPQTFYWPSSPSSGGSFDNPKDPNVGDVHYWDVWHGQKPFTDYRNYHFRFCSEFGFQSFPSLKTVETFTVPEDRNIFSRIMEKHQKNDDANGKILYYLSENFLYPKNFDTLLYTSQLLQAEAIKYGVEHWRRNLGRCMGALYWQLNDCWPVASWSSIDYFGRWKALHYYAKKFYDPILLSIEESEKEASIYITNDTLKSKSGHVEWKLRNNKSEVIEEGAMNFKVDPLTAKACANLNFSETINEMTKYHTYLEATLYIDGSYYSQTSVIFCKPKHFVFLDPKLSVKVEDKADHFELIINAEAYTKYVEIETTAGELPLSDNYFDLSANEPKHIKISKERVNESLNENMIKLKSVYHINH